MTHDGAIESELTHSDKAVCSCGWKGPDRTFMEDAETDLMKHYDEVAL